MPEETLRTFIAIELDEPLRIALKSVQDKLKRRMPPGAVRWVDPYGIHLTLKFLGDTPGRRLGELEAALQAAVAQIPPFDFVVEGRGVFPNARRPRVIWAAVREKSGALVRLQAAVEQKVSPLGWPAEERGFSPHLTLGRVTRSADRQAEEAVGRAVEDSVVEEIGRQQVDQISLIRSDLRSTGAVYTPLFSVALPGASGRGAR